MANVQDKSSENVKRIRKEKKMSLRALAQLTQLSPGFLSNYENNKTSITISALRRISEALGVPVNLLLADFDNPDILIVKKENRLKLLHHKTKSGHAIQEFLTKGVFFDMEVTIMTLPPHSDSGKPSVHGGEEFVFGLRGTIEVVIDFSSYLISEGEMAYYPACCSHQWRNDSDEMAEFMVVASKGGF